MTPQAAKAVLDRVRDGESFHPRVVAMALYLTGDINDIELERIHGICGGVHSVWDASTEGSPKVQRQRRVHQNIHAREN